MIDVEVNGVQLRVFKPTLDFHLRCQVSPIAGTTAQITCQEALEELRQSGKFGENAKWLSISQRWLLSDGALRMVVKCLKHRCPMEFNVSSGLLKGGDVLLRVVFSTAQCVHDVLTPDRLTGDARSVCVCVQRLFL